MYECEILFGLSRGVDIQRMVEEATGQPCPCKRQEPCLLLPAPGAAEDEAVAV